MNLTDKSAASFAEDWIASWNSHNLERVLGHYAEDVIFYSPFAQKLLNDPAGCVRGKAALRAYFSRALAAFPELHFTLHEAMRGVSGVTLVYTSVRGLHAAETMLFDADGQVAQVFAHYDHAD
jgi:ketosteroid isomerase-like protein